MKKLKDLVSSLKEATGKNEIVKILQEIGAELLTKYEIRVKNITIEPLRVEPYLFLPTIFEDKFMHYEDSDNGRIYGPCQRNHFGKLYIHKGYSGVDIVLSNREEYAFSFLIKNSRILIDNKVEVPFVKQYGVAKILKEHGIKIGYDELVLFEKDSPNDTVVFKTIRNGLRTIAEREDFKKEEQENYNELLISSFIELKEHTSCQFDFEKGFGGDKAVVEYLKKYKKSHPIVSKNDLDSLRKKLYPNGSKTEFEREFK